MNVFLDIETIPTQNKAHIDRIAETIKPPATMKKAKTIAEWEKNDKQSAIDEAVSKTGLDGVKPPACFPINPNSWDASIFDTMTYWAGHGNRISLDNLCFALGIEGKTDFTWQDVYPAYQRGDFESIGNYCKNDVEITRNVYNKLMFK